MSEQPKAESIEFFKACPDNHMDNRSYRVLFAQGDGTCSIARSTGTMKGPMKGQDGKEISPTNKAFEIEFCTSRIGRSRKTSRRGLFCDLVGMFEQIGIM